MTTFIPTRRALLTLLGAAPAALTTGATAGSTNSSLSTSLPSQEGSPPADHADPFIEIMHDLDRVLCDRDQAVILRDRLEAELIAVMGYPRVRLPHGAGSLAQYAADRFSIDRALGPGRWHLRGRLYRELAHRQRAWSAAADRIGLPQAIAAEDRAREAVQRSAEALLSAPATSRAAIRLKFAVILAIGQPGPADQAAFPWRELRLLLEDVKRLAT